MEPLYWFGGDSQVSRWKDPPSQMSILQFGIWINVDTKNLAHISMADITETMDVS